MQQIIIWFTVEIIIGPLQGVLESCFSSFFSTSDSWSYVPLKWEDLRRMHRDQRKESPETEQIQSCKLPPDSLALYHYTDASSYKPIWPPDVWRVERHSTNSSVAGGSLIACPLHKSTGLYLVATHVKTS